MKQNKPRVRFNHQSVAKVDHLMKDLKLHTVCAEATCPNLGECFDSGTATLSVPVYFISLINPILIF